MLIEKELSGVYARLLNQYKFNYQIAFSPRFEKQDENNQVFDEIDLFITLNINHNKKESDLDNIDVKSPLEQQIKQQEMKDSGWRLDKINSMTVYFYKTGEMDGRAYVKIPLRSLAFLYIENYDNNCFLWSKNAHLHPSGNIHPKRVSSFRQNINELTIQEFDFIDGFKCSDGHKFEKLKSLSFIKFELNFYQDQKKWRLKLIPFEVWKVDSYGVIDFIKYNKHYALIRKLNVFLGGHHKNLPVDYVWIHIQVRKC